MLFKNIITNENPGFKLLYFKRLMEMLSSNKNLLNIFYLKILRYYYRGFQIKFGIDIPYKTKIGEGAVIPHFGVHITRVKYLMQGDREYDKF